MLRANGLVFLFINIHIGVMRDDIKEYIEQELKSIDTDDLYNDMLDEAYPDLTIAGLPYQTSTALKEIDPTAYRCGKNDYIDSVLSDGDFIEIDEKLFSKNACIDLWFDRLASFESDLIACIQGVLDESDIPEDGIDVRFGVAGDQFLFRTGSVDYDQDSLCVACGSLDVDTKPMELAAALIDQVKDWLLEEIA
jgi:hypothetical protein